ncbi:MAG: PhoH family protein [Pseudomonadales bacterium]|nr:PhoH family protein [Pseudomonadales bacterium]
MLGFKGEKPLNSAPGGSLQLTLEPYDGARLATVCGQFHENLKLIEQALGVVIKHRENHFYVRGSRAGLAHEMLATLYKDAEGRDFIGTDEVHVLLRASLAHDEAASTHHVLMTRKGAITPRGARQQTYVENILKSDISFGVGPAGTGKTWLAVACAVDLLEKEAISRLLLVRPAVEAGEKLGFLPGDLSEKINPYLRPLYDALYEMLGFDRVGKLIERNVIEVAPLAYMRGRTLNQSFVILDEGQNTTPEQMKMFLTRLGLGSKAVITGDITQVDLPSGQMSGLTHAMQVLKGVEQIPFTEFTSRDVVRHELVQHIVEAYDRWDASHTTELPRSRRQNATRT